MAGQENTNKTTKTISMKFSKPLIITALMAGNLIAWDLATRAQESTTNTPPPPAAPQRGMRGALNVDQVSQQLNLTDDQKPKVKAVLDDMNKQNRDLRQDQSVTGADRRAKMQSIRDDANTKLKAILTADQFQQWQTLSRQRGNRRGAGGAAGGGAGGAAAGATGGAAAATNAPPQN
jgi:Spy/CpxP family protein refolding chaperone